MLEQFYRDVLPGNGFYTLFRGDTKAHVWADSISGLLNRTQELIDVPDLYFATASYAEIGTKFGGRTQANVLALRALRLDIDAGEEKHARGQTPYLTRDDALAALLAFVQSSGVKPSYVISSGAGLHVYYCLSEDVSPEDWLPVAAQLQSAALESGLAVDRSVSCDSARILRPVGSLHYSGARVEILKRTGAVYTLAALASTLPAATAPAPTPKAAGKFDMSVNDELNPVGPPRSVAKIVKHCAAIRHAGQHQDQTPEPLWRAMLGVVKFTVEGLDAAHIFSRKHPDYDAADTEEKYNRWTAGPATCAEIEKNFSGCSECVHHNKIRSPIVLGEMSDAEQEAHPEVKPSLPELPKPEPTAPWAKSIPAPSETHEWFVRDSGSGPRLWVRMAVQRVNEAGEKVTVYVPREVSSMFWFDAWSSAVSSDDEALATLRTVISGQVRNYDFRQKDSATPQVLKTYLSSKAIHVAAQKNTDELLMTYAKSSLEQIKAAAEKPKVTDRFGVRIIDGNLAVVQGKYIINHDGTIREAALSENLRAQVDWYTIDALPRSDNGRWGPEVWAEIKTRAKEHVAFLTKYYGKPGFEPYQLAVMMGMSSPLMPFVSSGYASGSALPPGGISVSLYSRSPGRGKTTAIMSAMLAYGNVNNLVREGNKEGSTALARISRLSNAGSFPVSFDEMGRVDPADLTNLLSAVANGAARDRSGQYGGAVVSARWALVNLMSGNRPARDMVSEAQAESSAIQARLLEIDITNVPNLDADTMKAFGDDFAAIKTRAEGALGAMIHLAICRLGVERINKLCRECADEAGRLVGYEQGNRFQWRALGTTLALQKILETLGLAPFSRDTLVRQFQLSYSEAAAYVELHSMAASPVELMQQCLNDLAGKTLVTNTMNRGGRGGAKDTILNLYGRAPENPAARYVTTEQTIYLTADAFKDWCLTKRVSMGEILNGCKAIGLLLPTEGQYLVRRDLFLGLDMDGMVRRQTYTVDMRKLPDVVIEHVDEANVTPIRRPTSGVSPKKESA